jgi:PTH1 family peptidyl-tRNA hydrolase
VVGLGNPGSAYRGTFHNAGREVAELLARKRRAPLRRDARCKAQVAEIREGFILLPENYMNLSGAAVHAFAEAGGLGADSLLVLVDDVYLDLGVVRIRKGGASGGHNGLKSVEESMGTDAYDRVRIGVGPDPGGALRSEYVLSRPRPEIEAAFFEGKARALAALETTLEKGVDHAMNVFN